jgi:membrane associated rhomboid family serine protease
MRPITDRLSPLIKAFVIANVLVFAFYALVKEGRGFIDQHLILGPGTLRGEVWQPITTLFVHVEPLSFLFNMIGLWFVGATIERLVGLRKFLVLYFVPAAAAHVAIVLVGFLLGRVEFLPGGGMAILALFVTFGKYYGRTPARILGGLVVQAKNLALVLVGFALFMDIVRGSVPHVVGDLVAVGLSFLLSPGDSYGIGRLLGRLGPDEKKARRARRFEVLEGGRRGERDKDADRPRYLN